MYYDINDRQMRIPTILAIFFLFLIVGSLAFLLGNKSQKTSIQAGEVPLKSFMVTNCTAYSCTLIAETVEKLPMWVIYGKEDAKLTFTESDRRDLEKDRKNRNTHYFEINKNLVENTTYDCRLITNKGVAGNKCQFSTSPSFTTLTSNLSPVIGKVSAKNGSLVKEAIVILEIDGANKLSTLTGDTGGWVIPFYPLTKLNTFQLFQPSSETLVKIKIIDESVYVTNISSSFKKLTLLESKTIILGNDLNLEDGEADVLSASSEVEEVASTFDIIIPNEGALISGQKPYFKGTAEPGRRVKLTIGSTQSYIIYSDRNGVWSYSLSRSLNPGKYTLTAITKNPQGQEIRLTRTFNIIKSGESVLGEATPSATLAPSVSPTLTPQVTTSAAPTSAVTPTLTPTPEILTPSLTLAPTDNTPTPSPPQSGLNIIPLSLLSAILIILGAGLILLF